MSKTQLAGNTALPAAADTRGRQDQVEKKSHPAIVVPATARILEVGAVCGHLRESG